AERTALNTTTSLVMKKLLIMIDQPPTIAARPTSNNDSKHSSNPRQTKPSTFDRFDVGLFSAAARQPSGPIRRPGSPLPESGSEPAGTAGEDDPSAIGEQSLGLRAPALDGILKIADDGESGKRTPRGKPVYDSKASPREAGDIAIFCVRAPIREIAQKSRNQVPYRSRRGGQQRQPRRRQDRAGARRATGLRSPRTA
ncbi:MAG TPA: hypothetical protein PK752_01520, partial [Accumulibacter sp.]|uniref:hypothetical protein n=1 Tax=Accumulibacter sp. TaxID=2053492 RepID=UPI002D1BC5E7